MCVANHEEGPRRRRHLEVHLLGSDRQSLRLDKRLGHYFLEWWDGNKRCRENAGEKHGREAAEKAHGDADRQGARALHRARQDALPRQACHPSAVSPGPRHFERILGKKKYMEAVTRSDMDDYKTIRSRELFGDRPVSPATINFEITILRALFYYVTRERGVSMDNPCARFKHLRSEKERLKGRPPVYGQAEIDKIFAECNDTDRAIFATLVLTGQRKDELVNLTWDDVDLNRAILRVTAKGDFAPKDYEEREIPLPPELVGILRELPRTSTWVFPSARGNRLGPNEMLRRLKDVAERVAVKHATLHKFRHTYATRLLEDGCDIVTVQHLLGHSDLETTRKYLSPDRELARKAVNRLKFMTTSK